jgi:hypothetical protein
MPQPIDLSASRGPAVLGVSGFQTQFSVWQEMMEQREPGFNASRGFVLPEREETAAIRWGLAFEDAIAGLAGVTGDRQKFITEKKRPYITAHLDGTIDPINKIHEGKTTNIHSYREKWGDPGSDRVPAEYQVQGQHQSILVPHCGGVQISVLVFPKRPEEWEKEGLFVEHLKEEKYQNDHIEKSLWVIRCPEPGSEKIGFPWTVTCYDWARTLSQMGFFHTYTIAPDRDLQKTMLDAYQQFWQKNIVEKIAPEPGDYDDVRRMFKEPHGIVLATEQVARWVAEYVTIGEEIGTAGPMAKRRNQIKTMVLDFARKASPTFDEDAKNKVLIQDVQGNTIATFDGKTFRGRE